MKTGDVVLFGCGTRIELPLRLTVAPRPARPDMLPHECTCAQCRLLCMALRVPAEDGMRGSSAWVCWCCDRMIVQEGTDAA